MRTLTIILFLICLSADSAVAQRDPPVWDSFLPRTVVHKERLTFDLELTWNKGGGPKEARPHAQMYVLLYLKKDEDKILKLAALDENTNRKNSVENLIVNVLEKKKLATVLETKVVEEVKTAEASKLKKFRAGSYYDFSFSFKNSQLLEKHKELSSFDPKTVTEANGRQLYDEEVKLLVLIPVNDTPLATLIPKKSASYDFARIMDFESSIHFFKPLPQTYKLTKQRNGNVTTFIN